MELERSPTAKFAKSVFFQDDNQIDIYIEDTAIGSEKIYTEILRRVFDGTYEIGKIFPLGGRFNVKKIYSNQINKISRPSLFIVDGDLELIKHNNNECKPGLYVMPMYCIESLLICGNAWCQIAHEDDPINNLQTIYKSISFGDWKQTNEQFLFDLFLTYAVAQKIDSGIQTIGYPIGKLLQDDLGNLCKDKVTERISSMEIEIIEKHGKHILEETKKEVEFNFLKLNIQKIDIVSGKDYLHNLFKIRFRKVTGSKISDLVLKNRLAMKCSIDKIKNIVDYVAHP